MWLKKKSKPEKTPEQEAYEYGIKLCITELQTGVSDKRELLSQFEKFKKWNYPPRCGTCGGRLD